MSISVCPNCGTLVDRAREPYCPNCRQSLDDEDDVSPGDFARKLYQLTPYTPVTPIMIGLNCLVFGIMAIGGVNVFDPTVADLLKFGANFGPLTLHGEPWRLFTCMFVHIGIMHLFMNMWALLVLGRMVERFIGPVGFLVLYLLTGLAGSMVSVAWSPNSTMAGASGAIFGIFGAVFGIYRRAAKTIPKEFLSRHRAEMLKLLVLNLIIGVMLPGISMSAHLGGLASGFLCGLALGHPLRDDSASWRLVRGALVFVVGGILLTGAFLIVQDMAGRIDPRLELEEINERAADVSRAYNDAIQKKSRGAITDQKLIEILENDVLPPWRKLRARLAGVKDADPALGVLLKQSQKAMELTEESWEMLARAIRQNDPDLRRKAAEKLREADRIEQAINNEVEKKRR